MSGTLWTTKGWGGLKVWNFSLYLNFKHTAFASERGMGGVLFDWQDRVHRQSLKSEFVKSLDGLQLPIFNADCCIQPTSIRKMFPSLCFYSGRHWRELTSWDQFPPVPPACQHVNIPSHFTGLGSWGSVCKPGSGELPAMAMQDPAWRLLCSHGYGEVSVEREGTGSMGDFLVKGNKEHEQGAHTSLLAPIIISTVTTNLFF